MSSRRNNISSIWFDLKAGEKRTDEKRGIEEKVILSEAVQITSMGSITEITTAYRRELHRNLDYAINEMNNKLKQEGTQNERVDGDMVYFPGGTWLFESELEKVEDSK